MTMYEEKPPKYVEIRCFQCDKLIGLYYSSQPEIFKDQFFCTIKCKVENEEKKKRKQKENLTEQTLK